ncbi:hypothetical protein [uncultured Draconibacterium sp.]|uniref:hypothetical protein n=1 Tax=uncultured Draconibacterium sp. TaxID=1573823 RepID=UPI0029C84665|nr:hypothetical protein [uncultured Draconibacterium sp.]
MKNELVLNQPGVTELGREKLKTVEGGIIGVLEAFAAGMMLYFASSVIENPESAWEGFKDAFN